MDLSGTWEFVYDDEDVGREQRWAESTKPFDRNIEVPYPPESKLSGIGDGGFHPVVWYRRTFALQPAPGNRLLLHFAAVDYRASVWVNDRLVVEHEGGHTPFAADITDVLRPDGGQTVVVRAEDLPSDLGQPRGKQDWLPEPHSIWYGRTSGIWQPVWLEEVPAAHIDVVQDFLVIDEYCLHTRTCCCTERAFPVGTRAFFCKISNLKTKSPAPN